MKFIKLKANSSLSGNPSIFVNHLLCGAHVWLYSGKKYIDSDMYKDYKEIFCSEDPPRILQSGINDNK